LGGIFVIRLIKESIMKPMFFNHAQAKSKACRSLYLLPFAFLLFVTIPGCKKDPDIKKDYLVFGTFFGFCAGPHCVDIYKMDAGKLFEDTADLYPMQKNNRERIYIQRTQDKFEISKKLFKDFPSKLLNEPSQIGSPDDHDQGGVLIGIMKDGHEQFWMIDNDKQGSRII
jgi:hypothetical protein